MEQGQQTDELRERESASSNISHLSHFLGFFLSFGFLGFTFSVDGLLENEPESIRLPLRRFPNGRRWTAGGKVKREREKKISEKK